MNVRRLAWKNLMRRKSRALFTGLGIFLGIGTFVAITSVTQRMEGAVRDQLDRFGANILVAPATEHLSLGFGDISLGGTEVSRAVLTSADESSIRSISLGERLRLVAPFFLAAADASGRDRIWMGVRPSDLAEARPWWKIDGSPIREKDEVLLGAETARLLDKGAGGTVESGGRVYRVAGVLHPTGDKEDGMVIASIGEVRALARAGERVTFFEVAALCKACPVEDIVAEIGGKLPGAKVTAIRSVVESRRAAVDQFRRLGLTVSAVVLTIGGLMVFVTIMGNVQERTREIGILRAVGFRRRAILSLLFWETGWIALAASLSGGLLGTAAAWAGAPLFGAERGTVAAGPLLVGTLLGLGLGLMGAVPPARRAAALSPTEAIRAL
jgi:putative ABC transport system permease protein